MGSYGRGICRRVGIPAWVLIGLVAGVGCTPRIKSIQPASGLLTGGTGVIILGEFFPKDFASTTQILIGTVPCTELTVIDGGHLSCVTGPYHEPATLDVALRSPDQLLSTLSGGFSYVEPFVVNPKATTMAVSESYVFSVAGGLEPYEFLLYSGEGTVTEVRGTGFRFTAPTTSGGSVVRVSDASGAQIKVAIKVQGGVAIEVDPVTTEAQVGDTLIFSASGGMPTYTFTNGDPSEGQIVPDGSDAQYTVTSVGDGTDTITVTDRNGDTASFALTLQGILSMTATQGTHAVVGGNTMAFDVTAGTGVPPYTFLVLGGEGSITSVGTAATYTPPATLGASSDAIMVIDDLGHTDVINIDISDEFLISGVAGVVVGTPADFEVSGGVQPYDLGSLEIRAADCAGALLTGAQWLDADTIRYTPDTAALTAGTVAICVDDAGTDGAGGNAHTASITLDVNQGLFISADRAAIVARGNGGATNTITFTIGGGAPDPDPPADNDGYVIGTTFSDAFGSVFTDNDDGTATLVASSGSAVQGTVEVTAFDAQGNTAVMRVIVLPPFEPVQDFVDIALDGRDAGESFQVDGIGFVGARGGMADLFQVTVQDITYVATSATAQGLGITIDYDDSVLAGNETVDVNGSYRVTVDMESTVSTASQIAAAVNADPVASSLVTAVITGNGNAAQTSTGGDDLVGGYATIDADIDGAGGDDIRLIARVGGIAGNSIELDLDNHSGVTAGSEVVDLYHTGSVYRIQVAVEAAVSTADQVAAAINADPVASLLVTAQVLDADTLAPDTGAFPLAGATEALAFTSSSPANLPVDSTRGEITGINNSSGRTITVTDSLGNTTSIGAKILVPVQVEAGGYHTCARLACTGGTSCSGHARIKCWGRNHRGQLGLGHTRDVGAISFSSGNGGGTEITSIPFVDLGTDSGTGRPLTVTQVRLGLAHTCAIVSDSLLGSLLKCWGENGLGQLGTGDFDNRGDEPGEMGDDLPFVDPGTSASPIESAPGWTHTCAIWSDGRARCWGDNAYGKLGNDDDAYLPSPTPVSVQLINSSTIPNWVTTLGITGGARTIASGKDHSCAIRLSHSSESHVPLCWGRGHRGQLGIDPNDNGGATDAGVPDSFINEASPVDDDDNGFGIPSTDFDNQVVQIVAGGDLTCESYDTSDNTFDVTANRMTCFGAGTNGERGNNTSVDQDFADRTTGFTIFPSGRSLNHTAALTNKSMITAGMNHVCALLNDTSTDNRLRCWGLNDQGQLGYDDTTSRGGSGMGSLGSVASPNGLAGTDEAIHISAGRKHTCAVFVNNSAGRNEIFCWGDNAFGQLGIGSTTDKGDTANSMSTLIPVGF